MGFRKVAAVAGAVVAGGALFAAPATAEPAMADCAPELVCVYDGYNLTGEIYMFGLSDLNYADDAFASGLSVNDRSSSVWNRTGQHINFYVHSGANIGDLCFRLEPYGSRSNLGSEGCDNSVSSHYPAGV
jgi:hypothetical protein